MEKAYKSFSYPIHPERQNLGSLFGQDLIQMLINLNFTTCQVSWFSFSE